MDGFNPLIRFYNGIVKLVGATTQTEIGNVGDALKVSGSFTGLGNILEGVIFDYILVTYPSSTQEIYVYKNGGSGGTVKATITVTYSNSTKENISSVERV